MFFAEAMKVLLLPISVLGSRHQHIVTLLPLAIVKHTYMNETPRQSYVCAYVALVCTSFMINDHWSFSS